MTNRIATLRRLAMTALSLTALTATALTVHAETITVGYSCPCGCTPAVTLEEGLPRTIAWQREAMARAGRL